VAKDAVLGQLHIKKQWVYHSNQMIALLVIL